MTIRSIYICCEIHAFIFIMDKDTTPREVNMIEAIAVPILVKAIEFLFDESKKILEERKIRRQAELETSTSNNLGQQKMGQSSESIAATDLPTKLIDTKQNTLNTKIDETRLKSVEKDLAHLLGLCEIFKSNLYNAKEKYARFGRDYAPPHLLYEIKENEEGLLDSTRKINKLLSQIYEKEIIVPNLD